MGFITVFLIALALAMDAFSIALSKGLAAKRQSVTDALKLGVTFGTFQFVMPLIGFFLAGTFASFIETYSKYISFALLVFIGGKMLFDAIREMRKGGDEKPDSAVDFKSLIILGIATSIDALAVGVTFAFDGTTIAAALYYCMIIGIVALVLSFVGYFIGNKLGGIIGDKGEIIGGVVLIVLGIKMLF
ncbi:MAG: manganese efflux pump MntP family protein [Acutalibacteraceae bacterium]